MSSRVKSAGQINVYRSDYIKELTQNIPEKKVNVCMLIYSKA